jgi:hypothetical protein
MLLFANKQARSHKRNQRGRMALALALDPVTLGAFPLDPLGFGVYPFPGGEWQESMPFLDPFEGTEKLEDTEIGM